MHSFIPSPLGSFHGSLCAFVAGTFHCGRTKFYRFLLAFFSGEFQVFRWMQHVWTEEVLSWSCCSPRGLENVNLTSPTAFGHSNSELTHKTLLIVLHKLLANINKSSSTLAFLCRIVLRRLAVIMAWMEQLTRLINQPWLDRDRMCLKRQSLAVEIWRLDRLSES